MKDRDPFKEWRGREDVLILTVPAPSDLVEEVAGRLDGRRFPSFSILKALPGLACVELAYQTADRLTLENFTGGKGAGTWPIDLAMQVGLTASAVKNERDEQAEQRRKERDEQDFERNHAELQRRGVLFPDGPARREALRRVN